MKINGTSFSIKNDEPLESAINRLSSSLQYGKNYGLARALLPEARAAGAGLLLIVIGAAIVIPSILRFAVLVQETNQSTSLEKALKECEERDPKTPYATSKTKEARNQLFPPDSLDLEKIKKAVSCEDYIENEQDFRDTLIKNCQLSLAFIHCSESYQKGSLPKATLHPSKKTSSLKSEK